MKCGQRGIDLIKSFEGYRADSWERQWKRREWRRV